MGIQGLLPQLKSIQNPVSLRRYEGQTLGIDGYAWLHKAAYSCAYELVMGEPTERYLNYFIKRFALLKTFNIQPYLIFDGDGVPVKKGTENKRREKRIENKEIAERLWKSGEKKNAIDFFQKCVDITPSMAKCVIDYCNTNHIKYIVAPFEADPQMVYLEQKGLIHGIISEDSDLLIFGCRRLITKLNDYGECIEICKDDFNKLPTKFPLGQLNGDQIRMMVCLSGCDYTDGIPKIGLVTAMKLINRLKDIKRIILHIQREGKLKVPKDFLMEYERACYGFLYQRVFCPINRKIVSLHDIPEQLALSPCHRDVISTCIGCVIHKDTHEKKTLFDSHLIDHDIHLKQAMGELDPYDYTKRLISREKVLQLSSKSDMTSNAGVNSSVSQNTNPKKRKLQRKSIDSFFKPSNLSLGTKTLQYSAATVSSFNLGASTIPAFVDKEVETVKKRRLATRNYEHILLSSNTKSTSKFFGNNKGNKTISNVSLLQLQDATESNSQLNSSQVSTTIEDSISPEISVDDNIPESQLSTDIPSSLSLLDMDSMGKSSTSKEHDRSSNKTPLENAECDLKTAAVYDSGHHRVVRIQNKAPEKVMANSQVLETNTRSSSGITSSQYETEVNEVVNSDTTEHMSEIDDFTQSSSRYKACNEIYSKSSSLSFDANNSNVQISSKISSLQTFRYSSNRNEKALTTYPLQPRDINSKNLWNRKLKSGKEGIRQQKNNLDSNSIIKDNDSLRKPSLVGLNRRKTYNGFSSTSQGNDSTAEKSSHSFNSSIGHSQSSIHIRIKRKSGSIGNTLESDASVRRSTSLLSQFKYQGK